MILLNIYTFILKHLEFFRHKFMKKLFFGQKSIQYQSFQLSNWQLTTGFCCCKNEFSLHYRINFSVFFWSENIYFRHKVRAFLFNLITWSIGALNSPAYIEHHVRFSLFNRILNSITSVILQCTLHTVFNWHSLQIYSKNILSEISVFSVIRFTQYDTI